MASFNKDAILFYLLFTLPFTVSLASIRLLRAHSRKKKPRLTAGLRFAAEILHMLFRPVVMVPVVMLFVYAGFTLSCGRLRHGKTAHE